MSPRPPRASALLLTARALDGSPGAVVISRPDGRVLLLNAAASRMLGCTARSAPRLGFPWLRDGDLRKRRADAAVEGAEPAQRTVEARRADGTRFRASVTLNPLGRGRRAAVAAYVRELSTEGPRDGAGSGDVLPYAAGGFAGPDALMARIGHDLSNPLAIVVAQATVLHDLAPDPGVARRAERIVAAAQRAGRIVESLAAMAWEDPRHPASLARGAERGRVGQPTQPCSAEMALRRPAGRPNAEAAEGAGGPRAGLAAALSVLIVDDEPDVGEALADVVGLLGHRALVAASAEAALDALRGRRFDAAILDLHMPGMDGIALRNAIAALDPGLAGRIAIFTGDGTGRLAEGAAAPFPTLRKPFTLGDVGVLLLRLTSP